ncbi:MAG: FmdB family transcriptional regulator, partial [Planctomycetes bacterium SM23_32]
RLITGGAGLIFKGRGFYATDSRRAARTANREGGRTCCGRQTRCDTPPCRQ